MKLRCLPSTLTSQFTFLTQGRANMRSAERIRSQRGVRVALMSATISFSLAAATVGVANDKSKDNDAAAAVKTESPIKHVIILIGENRGMDHTFGVYKPAGRGETISNILYKGIVKNDGSPGASFALAQQFLVKPQ